MRFEFEMSTTGSVAQVTRAIGLVQAVDLPGRIRGDELRQLVSKVLQVPGVMRVFDKEGGADRDGSSFSTQAVLAVAGGSGFEELIQEETAESSEFRAPFKVARLLEASVCLALRGLLSVNELHLLVSTHRFAERSLGTDGLPAKFETVSEALAATGRVLCRRLFNFWLESLRPQLFNSGYLQAFEFVSLAANSLDAERVAFSPPGKFLQPSDEGGASRLDIEEIRRFHNVDAVVQHSLDGLYNFDTLAFEGCVRSFRPDPPKETRKAPAKPLNNLSHKLKTQLQQLEDTHFHLLNQKNKVLEAACEERHRFKRKQLYKEVLVPINPSSPSKNNYTYQPFHGLSPSRLQCSNPPSSERKVPRFRAKSRAFVLKHSRAPPPPEPKQESFNRRIVRSACEQFYARLHENPIVLTPQALL